MEILKDDTVSIDALAGKTVAVLGYGNQGRAQALNLRDSGVPVEDFRRMNLALVLQVAFTRAIHFLEDVLLNRKVGTCRVCGDRRLAIGCRSCRNHVFVRV